MKFYLIIVFSLLLIINKYNFPQTLDDRVNSLIDQMTLQEKILQLHKEGGFNTADNIRLGIPGFVMADGPHGVRDSYATSFPVGISMAATWDRDLIYRVGFAMGEEFKGKGKHQALGPCLDLNRDPRNGRSPESGGEDPYLVSQITTTLIKGIQDAGVIATAKHYNGVNRQINRTSNNVIVSERLLNEHYGLNFRTAVQEGGVMSVMNSYNLINGEKCAENHHLLMDILRTYWGFPFYIVSDWGSIWNSENAINAGCNVCMGSDNYENDLLNLVQSGTVSEDVINDAIKRVLRTKILAGMLDYYPKGDPNNVNSVGHQQLSLEAGRESIILLKNEDNLLPLDKETITTVAIIGPSANVAQLDGSGSSYVTPFYSVSPREGIENKIGIDKVLYAKGCDINSTNTSEFQEALNIAAISDVVIFFGGLDDSQEGEGFDRVGGSTLLPGEQLNLINQLAAVNTNLIVVIESGGICSINPAINNIKSLIYTFYPGQEGGNALGDVIFGDYNPGGKLPVTMPKNDSQLPAWNDNFNDDYGCGYRWYDKQKIIPEFPFGFGLSYTTFEYSNLFITPATAPAGQIITVKVDVTNTGTVAGDEVVQLYISDSESSMEMPVKQLKGYKRIYLQPNQTKTVTFELASEAFYYFDDSFSSFQIEPGIFNIKVGGSSYDLPLSGNVDLLSAETKPDLRITNIKCFPPYPLKNDKVVFLAMIKNEGTGFSPYGVTHKVVFKVNGTEVSSSVELTEPIPTGAVRMVCANIGNSDSNWWVAGEPGMYKVEAMVDPDNLIDETVETNNSKTIQVEVFKQPPLNVALNKNVVVSSIEGSGLEGSNAVDGSLTTRWSSQFSDPQFIYVDLGEVKHLDRVDLVWETAYGKEYSIDVSNNAVDWTTVEHISNGYGGTNRIETSADARYVRMYGIQRGTEWGYSLYEFEVYDLSDTLTAIGSNESNLNNLNFELKNNYPNPFNPTTEIQYMIDKSDFITLRIYDILGKEVQTLVEDKQKPGKYNILFDGSGLPSGVYFYTLQTSSSTETKKMVLLK
jgi:beta-glucosidase